MVDGSLIMSDTQIRSNHSDQASSGIGGGIAIQDGLALITTSVITDNTASTKGGGIAIVNKSSTNSSSLLKLQDILITEKTGAAYYIGKNTGGSKDDENIAGNNITTNTPNTNFQTFTGINIDTIGNPPPSSAPENLPNYLGTANINDFCLSKGDSHGSISTNTDRNATDIFFTCFDQRDKPMSDFPGQAICKSQYRVNPGVAVIDRMANYFDPASLECYQNLQLLGSVRELGFQAYCISKSQYIGLFDDPKERQTAYDWLCQSKDRSKLPIGLSVADACALQYPNYKKVVDRLANFNTINGWECWAPV